MKAINVYPPEDGGTPRDPMHIVRMDENEFLIRAECTDAAERLKHARSRIDLWIENTGEETEAVFHLDLNPDNTRTDRDTASLFGQMDLRDYVYVKREGGWWERIHGRVDGWVCTVKLSLRPGRTALGLSPWYNYADALRFIGCLEEGLLLKKRLWGRSDHGREVWMVEISDFSVPETKKIKVLVIARQHAYETFSSFSAEGIARYLLSGLPEANLRHFAFFIVPMLNVDAVAEGDEYEGHYTQQRTDNAISRCEWGMLDQIRPDVYVLLHNWIAPRQMDTVVYTDRVAGQPSSRAWDILSGFFPKQTEYGRGWEHEEDLLLHKNWASRRGQKVNFTSEYASEVLDADVWIWEMPWFGRDNGDPEKIAATIGRKFIRALIQTYVRTRSLSGAIRLPGTEIRFLTASSWVADQDAALADITGEHTISLEQVAFNTGITLRIADSRSVCPLDGQWEIFRAVAGTQSLHEGEISIVADGVTVWSQPVTALYRKRVPINLPVCGVSELLILMSGCGVGMTREAALALADARVERPNKVGEARMDT